MRYQLVKLIPILMLAVSVGLLAPSHFVWHSEDGHHCGATAAGDCSGHGHVHTSASGPIQLPDSGDTPPPDSSHGTDCHICLVMLSLLIIAAVAWCSRLPLKSFCFPEPRREQPVVATAGIIWRRGPPA